MLITVHGRLVRSHGVNDRALPGSGVIQYQPATHGTHEGALRGTDPVPARIVDGEAEEVELTPGPWRISVFPEYGDAWEPYLVELTEDMDEPVDLADLAPVLAVDGERWTTGPRGVSVIGVRDNGDQTVTWLYSDGTESDPVRIAVGPEGEQGEQGDQGASVTGAVDHGDGTVSFTLSDGGTTDPVVMPPGPTGRGIESISDPDEDSLVTITYTDGSTSTVQAIRGGTGDTGPAPTVTWDGTTIIVDGEPGPDLRGAEGASAWEDVTGKPSVFPPAPHEHGGGEVTVDLGGGETTMQDAYESLAADTATARSEAGAAHSLAEGKADASHTHVLDDVDGLQAALDGAVAGLASESYADGAAADAVAAVPDADSERRGMMTAESFRDLTRLSAEPLSRRVLQDALTRQRTTGVGVIFAGSSTIQGDKATSTDRRPAQRISGYLTSRPAQTAVSGSAPADGVQVWAWGIGGSTSANYLTSSHYTAVGSIKPVLMVHMVGSNDWSGSRTPAQYETSMRAHLAELKAASPDTVHLLVGQHQRNSPATGSHPWEDYTAVLRTLAEEDPGQVEFLDLWPRYAAIGIPGADPWGWLYSDGIHLTDQSYRVLADWLAEHLGIPTPSGSAELYTGTLTGGSNKNSGDVILSATIPAKPYPRQGIAQGTVFAQKRATRSEMQLRVGGELLIVRPTIPKDTSIDGVSPPLLHRVVIPAHEEMTVQVVHNGNDDAYYSNKPDWGNLAVHISAC